MTRYLTAILVALLCAAGLFSTSSSAAHPSPSPLIVHEWGTFTSIAGPDGRAMEWVPQSGPADLPCFVERSAFNVKRSMWGTVRMETPVLYFYAPGETVVNVAVHFRSGVITEWFPHATLAPATAPPAPDAQTIVWRNVTIVPGGAEDFPVEPGASHYYAARRTAAAPLVVDAQHEKYLFYRGVGSFMPSITARVDAGGTVAIGVTPPARPVGDIILFSNDRGRLSYQIRHTGGAGVSVDPEVAGRQPTSELEQQLLAHGLYPDEATAMLDTWRDSWFEEGTRVIYIVPRSEIDSILPLQIEPEPSEIARVFVGRMELVTPATEKTVTEALHAGDTVALQPYRRFLQPIGRQILAKIEPTERRALEALLQDALSAWASAPDGCSQATTTAGR